MAVAKSLYRAPRGLADRLDMLDDYTARNDLSDPENPDFDPEIEVEVEQELDPYEEQPDEETPPGGEDEDFGANLAETLDEKQLATLAGELLEDFDDDSESRKEWIKTYVDGLELLGMKYEQRTVPWEDACGVYHPLMSEALVKFQAETMMETFPAQGPVKTEIIGKDTKENKDAATRVQEDMNHQLTDVMVEYRPEHERMLWGLGLAGNAFKKVYFDPSLGRQVAMYVPAEDVVVPYGASNLQTAERVTHVMRKTKNEIRRLQDSGFYIDEELGEPNSDLDDVEKKIAERMGFEATSDSRYKLLEMHVDLVIDDDPLAVDGQACPYVITIEKGTSTILAIRRNWDPDDERHRKRDHFVHYSYIPGFGFYAFGLIHLIGAFAHSGTSLLRQLVDAGTLSNVPGGFKTKGLRVKGDDTPIGPGEFRDVDVASGTMRDNIMPLPYKEPSQVLYNLLNTIVEEGRRFAAAADMKVSDMSAQAPVGTTLAILERTLKIMSAVQARIHYAMKQEFRLLKAIIREHTPTSYSYEPESGSRKAKQSDYDKVEIIPVSDPNAATMAQKIVQYQAVIQLAQTAPQIYDMPYLHRQMLEVLGIKNAQKLVPLKDDGDMKPRDPVSENMDVLNGKPVKAFIYQDHQAHITVHTSAMQDPVIMQMVGQNPQAQAMQAAMAAHLSEHVAFEYRKQIEQQAGVPYPSPDVEMDAETEANISRLAAAAAQKVLAANQAQAAQQQAQQAAQDPIVQMQQEELKIKASAEETKKLKVMLDAAAKADSHDIERERIAAMQETAGMQAGIKLATDKAALSSKEQQEGVRTGVEIARTLAQLGEQREAREAQQAARTPPAKKEYRP